MRITNVATTQHDAERVAIFVDDRFVLACHALLWLQSGLQIGAEIDEAGLARLGESEAVRALKDRALDLLAGRPRGRGELRQKLMHGTKARPAPPIDQINLVLDQLAADGWIDDQSFATFWVEQRDRFRPKGALALRAELRGKGVSREDSERAIEPERDLERALDAGRRKAQALISRPTIDARAFRDSLGPFLLRRGFNGAVAREAIATLWREYADEHRHEIDEALGESEDD